MASQYLAAGQLDQAESLYRQIFAKDPTNVQVARSLSALFVRRGQSELAIEWLKSAATLAPADADILTVLGDLYRNYGRFDDARTYYRRALTLQQNKVSILKKLTSVTQYTEYSDEIRSMETLYDSLDKNSFHYRQLGFALGKIFDDLKDYERAFRYFQEAKRVARAANKFNLETETKAFQWVKRVFDTDFFQRHAATGIADQAPIFVTGMPRSGTTLVEQILSSHPDVHGAGELLHLQNIVGELGQSIGSTFPVGFEKLGAIILNQKAEEYVARLRRTGGNALRITDKSLSAYLFIGLIAVMLPKARIVLCCRDPRDMGLSIFQKDFGNQQVYCHDLAELGHVYLLFNSLMTHWDRMLPGRIHTLQYESLVADTDTEIRKLLAYCELEFDPACLSFHESNRVVKTASRAQVRRPIYSDSVGRWNNYAEYLEPLLSVLNSGSG
jgi:tetratricopeptide (TPR) repeat protein